MVLSRQVLVVCSVIVLWAATMDVGHAFNFPGTTDAQMPPPPPSAAASTVSDASDPMVDLSRQGLINGTVSGNCVYNLRTLSFFSSIYYSIRRNNAPDCDSWHEFVHLCGAGTVYVRHNRTRR